MTKRHEAWSAEIIRGNTEVNRILLDYNPMFPDEVAGLLERDPTDIYASVVSSQFDADRRDYLRRDKMMTGTEQGGFDWAWLMNNLEVERLTIAGDDRADPFEVDGFILSSKALQAAEGYLLGRFHLYTQVYLHKTTRSAECMLKRLLERVAIQIHEGQVARTGLSDGHPLVIFIKNDCNILQDYLSLDDALLTATISELLTSDDIYIRELASRIMRRDLFKCFDVGARAEQSGGDTRAKFRMLLQEAIESHQINPDMDVLEDSTAVSPYKLHELESKNALEKILIRRPDGQGRPEDVCRLSPVIKALGERKIYRIYTRDEAAFKLVQDLWNRVV